MSISNSSANSVGAGEGVSVTYRRERGIPSECYCGLRAITVMSKTSTNPGRLFFSCVRATARADEECHIFKWIDEALVEEAEDVKELIRDIKTHMNNVSPDDLRELFRDIRTHMNDVQAMRATFDQQMKAVASKGKFLMVGVLGAIVATVAFYLMY